MQVIIWQVNILDNSEKNKHKKDGWRIIFLKIKAGEEILEFVWSNVHRTDEYICLEVTNVTD